METSDPTVFIEEKRHGYVRYQNTNGDRWEIEGICDHRGDCIIGAEIDGEIVSPERARELAEAYAGPDVPVLPEFTGCCPLTGRWL
jgi:hypothetical protein